VSQKVKRMNKKTEALMRTLKTEEVAVIHAAYEAKPVTVAFVDIDKSLSVSDKLEKAFMMTNSIDKAWYTNKGLRYVGPEKSCRSTGPKDYVLIGSDKYECKFNGWSKV